MARKNDTYTKAIAQNAINSVSEEVWIAGKGPSLDYYNWTEAGTARFGINETAFILPGCYGTFALDSHVLKKYEQKLPPNIIVFLRQRDYSFNKKYIYQRGKEYKTSFGTVNAAIQVLYYLGARTFHLIGCDAIDDGKGYSKKIIAMDAKGKNRDNYVRISKRIRETMRRLKDARFYLEHRKRSLALWKRY